MPGRDYPLSDAVTHEGFQTPPDRGSSGQVALARALFAGAARGMLIAMTGVLDQLALGLFEAFGLPLARLGERPGGLVGFLRGWFGTYVATDSRRFGGGCIGLLAGSIWSRHDKTLTRGSR